jgi:hypothetical protein
VTAINLVHEGTDVIIPRHSQLVFPQGIGEAAVALHQGSSSATVVAFGAIAVCLSNMVEFVVRAKLNGDVGTIDDTHIVVIRTMRRECELHSCSITNQACVRWAVEQTWTKSWRNWATIRIVRNELKLPTPISPCCILLLDRFVRRQEGETGTCGNTPSIFWLRKIKKALIQIRITSHSLRAGARPFGISTS